MLFCGLYGINLPYIVSAIKYINAYSQMNSIKFIIKTNLADKPID